MFVSFLVTLFLIKERRITVKSGSAERQGGIPVAALSDADRHPVRLHPDDSAGQLLHQPDPDAVHSRTVGQRQQYRLRQRHDRRRARHRGADIGPRLGRLGDRIGTARILIAALLFTTGLFAVMAWVNTPLQLGILRFLLGFADGALMPAVQALLLKYSSDQVTGRIFGYNQSFMYLGNVVGPLLGSGISAMMGFRWVFAVTAMLVLCNALQLRHQFKKWKVNARDNGKCGKRLKQWWDNDAHQPCHHCQRRP